MQPTPLTTTLLMRHGLAVHPGARIITDDGTGAREATFAEVASRADEIPKTSVGKFDKKKLRARYASGLLPVTEVADRSGE